MAKFDSYDALVEANRKTLLTGIMEGRSFAKTISEIVMISARYGSDSAIAGERSFVRTSLTSIEAVRLEAVQLAVEEMFSGTLTIAVDKVSRIASAFGHQDRTRKRKFNRIETALARIKSESKAVSPEALEAFFKAVNEHKDDREEIHAYVNDMMRNNTFVFNRSTMARQPEAAEFIRSMTSILMT